MSRGFLPIPKPCLKLKYPLGIKNIPQSTGSIAINLHVLIDYTINKGSAKSTRDLSHPPYINPSGRDDKIDVGQNLNYRKGETQKRFTIAVPERLRFASNGTDSNSISPGEERERTNMREIELSKTRRE